MLRSSSKGLPAKTAFALAVLASLGSVSEGARAQQLPPNPLKGVVKELRRGPLLIHGNYCGIGNRPGKAPIDELDAACMRHDACTQTGKLPSCACDKALRIEATAIAEDPRTAPDLKMVAAATASGMAVLICDVKPNP